MKILRKVIEVQIPDNFGDFNDCEKKIFERMKTAGCEFLEELLLEYEKSQIQKKRYLVQDHRQKSFQSLVGEVCLNRLRVFDRKLKRYVYLLDEWLGLNAHDKVSQGLRQVIVETCLEKSFRKATKEINFWTAMKRTPISNWELLQQEARRLKNEERKTQPTYNWKNRPLPSRNDISDSPEDPCSVLAIDLDGTQCKSQKKQLKNHDVKMAVIYKKKEPAPQSKKKWQLKEKQVVVGQTHESLDEFLSKVTQKAISHYGAHKNTTVVIHGDGDIWIKSFKTNYFDSALYRLDPWHLKKLMRATLGKQEIPGKWESLIYGKPDELIVAVEADKLNKTKPKSDQRQKFDQLLQYIKNNREGLLPSNITKEVKEKYTRLFLRGSGQMESNICSTICDRFKQRRMSWSSKGLDNALFLRERYLNNYKKPSYNVPVPQKRNVIGFGRHKYLQIPPEN